MATLVTKLFDTYGVRMLGFDIVWAEPDDSSGLQSLEARARRLSDDGAFQSAHSGLRPRLDYDARFAESDQGQAGRARLLFPARKAVRSGAIPAPVFPAGAFDGRDIPFTHWVGYGGNLPELQRAAAGGGHFNPLVDGDGLSRRVPILAEYHGAYYEALSLAMTRAVLGFPKVVPGFPAEQVSSKTYGALESVKAGPVTIPVDDNVTALIPYRGTRQFQLHLACRRLLDRVPKPALLGKIVLIGTSAPGLVDLRATPVGSVFPGWKSTPT